ncbi:MAG: hypothetical protein BJ554DRAFT_5992, partial [Olpidium bornovanus]
MHAANGPRVPACAFSRVKCECTLSPTSSVNALSLTNALVTGSAKRSDRRHFAPSAWKTLPVPTLQGRHLHPLSPPPPPYWRSTSVSGDTAFLRRCFRARFFRAARPPPPSPRPGQRGAARLVSRRANTAAGRRRKYGFAERDRPEGVRRGRQNRGHRLHGVGSAVRPRGPS